MLDLPCPTNFEHHPHRAVIASLLIGSIKPFVIKGNGLRS